MNSTYNWKYRIYTREGKTSHEFSNLVPQRVRVNIDKSVWSSHAGGKTAFSGISLMPYKNTDLNEFISRMKINTSNPQRVWDEFKLAIYEGWIHDKIHVIGASSGYDSRMVAKAIVELTKKYGRDWLGETYFVECGGEEPGFNDVMHQIGIQKAGALGIVWEPDYAFEYFDNLHERFNGLCAFPVNQWYDFFIKNWSQEEIQYISGYGGNVADALNPHAKFMTPVKQRMTIQQRLRHYFELQYYYQLSAFRQPKYSFHPIWSWRYIEAIAGLQHREARTAKYLCDIFVPECRHIPRMTILHDVHNRGFRNIKSDVVQKLYDWYRSTEYGRFHDIKPYDYLNYHPWWLNLCIANYAEANNISIY